MRYWQSIRTVILLILGGLFVSQAAAAGVNGVNSNHDAEHLLSLALPDLKGNMRHLGEWKGKVLMVNFWASWCSPCRYEIPEFVLYQRSHGGRGLQIIGIGVDEKRRLANLARSLDINYPVLVLDPMKSRKLMSDWGNNTGIIPYTVVLDPDGRIHYVHRGQMDEDTFNAEVLPLL